VSLTSISLYFGTTERRGRLSPSSPSGELDRGGENWKVSEEEEEDPGKLDCFSLGKVKS
jgi:hypothetical protein